MKMFRARLFATITLAGFVTAAMAQASGDPAPVSVSTARMVRMAPQVALPGTVVSRNDSKLASEVAYGTFRVRRNGQEHSTLQIEHEGHRIWGITANLTRRFRDLALTGETQW